MRLFGLLSELLGSHIERTVKEAIAPLPFYIRKLALGATVILLSVVGLGLTFLFLLMALFFAIANYHALVVPALWTSLISTVAGLLCLWIGFTLVRKPRL
jgi:hypothetical protein